MSILSSLTGCAIIKIMSIYGLFKIMIKSSKLRLLHNKVEQRIEQRYLGRKVPTSYRNEAPNFSIWPNELCLTNGDNGRVVCYNSPILPPIWLWGENILLGHFIHLETTLQCSVMPCIAMMKAKNKEPIQLIDQEQKARRPNLVIQVQESLNHSEIYCLDFIDIPLEKSSR